MYADNVTITPKRFRMIGTTSKSERAFTHNLMKNILNRKSTNRFNIAARNMLIALVAIDRARK